MEYTIEALVNVTLTSQKEIQSIWKKSSQIMNSLRDSESSFLRRVSRYPVGSFNWVGIPIEIMDNGELYINDKGLFINDIGQSLVDLAKEKYTFRKTAFNMASCVPQWEYSGKLFIHVGINNMKQIKEDWFKGAILARHTLCKLQSDIRWL